MLALLLVRPVSMLVSLAASRLPRRERLVAAWFGPKGFASVVYGLLVLERRPRVAAGVRGHRGRGRRIGAGAQLDGCAGGTLAHRGRSGPHAVASLGPAHSCSAHSASRSAAAAAPGPSTPDARMAASVSTGSSHTVQHHCLRVEHLLATEHTVTKTSLIRHFVTCSAAARELCGA